MKIDRKITADIAVFDKVAFTALVEKAKAAPGISQLKESLSPSFVQHHQYIDFYRRRLFNTALTFLTRQGNASMNAAIFHFFFTLAPELRGLRVKKKRKAAKPPVEAFSIWIRNINFTITGVCTDIMRKTMSHLAELVASAKAAINEASDVAALDNVRVEYG